MTSVNQVLVILTLVLYTSAVLLYFAGFRDNRKSQIASIIATFGFVSNLLVVVLVAVINNRLPLATGYEFLLCFTGITVLMYLFYEKTAKTRAAGGPVMLLAVLLFLVSAVQIFDRVGSGSLMPALKSPWLTVHVLTAVFAYSAFALSAGLALVQLRSECTDQRDDSIYRIVAGGFAMLSLSIVLGAIWAEQAWGSYWTWDPKETWALITWIIYALYLHLHRRPDWRGRNSAWIVLVGFILVLFTFFGVSYLLSGLHSYA